MEYINFNIIYILLGVVILLVMYYFEQKYHYDIDYIKSIERDENDEWIVKITFKDWQKDILRFQSDNPEVDVDFVMAFFERTIGRK